MTEQQIKQLKDVLDSSNAPDSSTELDQRILVHAKKRAAQLKFSSQLKPSVQLRASKIDAMMAMLSSNAVSAVALSIVLTVGVFLTMSQIILNDSQPQLVQTSQSPIEIEFAKTVDETISKPKMLNAGRDSFSMNKQLDVRDQILAQAIMPDVQDVIGKMEFSLAGDRTLAQLSLELAMTDIRTMIGQGRLDNARQRYELLRQSCEVCTLPSTLEALVMREGSLIDSS